MYCDDTNILVNSLLAKYYHKWRDLTAFFKSVDVGTTSEIVSSSNNTAQNKNEIALNDSEDMFTTGGLNSNASAQTSTKTKSYSGYKKFLLSNDLYDIVMGEVRTNIFINVF